VHSKANAPYNSEPLPRFWRGKMTNYWAAAANPKIYDIQKAIDTLETDLWTTKNSNVQKGDRLIIWKTLGNSDKRGIICFGEVSEDPIIQQDLGNPFWINPENGSSFELRSKIRYIKNPLLPLWIGGEHDDILLELSVAKSKGGTIFKVSPDQWEKLIDIIGDLPIEEQLNFWWVNNNQSFDQEIGGCYIWCPKRYKDGSTDHSFDNFPLVHKNDVIFSYADELIKAIGIVSQTAKGSNRPPEFGSSGYQRNNDGWLVKVNWTILEKPISPKNYIQKIAPLLPKKYSPIQPNGIGNHEVYLANISQELGHLLLDISEKRSLIVSEIESSQEEEKDKSIENEISASKIPETEKEQLIKSRIGQGIFRNRVAQIENKCRMSRNPDQRFLNASHIKPWRDCNNEERLDGYNGMLLSPHVDKLFDSGWISFSDEGKVLISNESIISVLLNWGFDPNMNVGSFTAKQKYYLDYHRKKIFKGD
jgi:putative restriction endonuclease